MQDVSEKSGTAPPAPRVLLITENASEHFGGEAVLPLHYFRVMRARGLPVWMILNERNRAALSGRLSPEEMEHLYFLPDDGIHRFLSTIKNLLPTSVGAFTIGQIVEIIDQRRATRLARKLRNRLHFNIVHQPTPVSPKHVSILWNRGRRGLGVPVVMGPMNGGISFPRGFRQREHPMDRAFVGVGRAFAGMFHRLFPGKLHAETLLVANLRTHQALPKGVKGRVEHLAENGVDLTLYRMAGAQDRVIDPAQPVTFVFAGRLVDLKGGDLLIEAFAKASAAAPMFLDFLGDGPCRPQWEKLAGRLGVADRVRFRGWMSHKQCAEHMAKSDVFVLPSLRECGGAVVLEAMAMRLPVIAANWGGPTDYVDASCGILVDPLTPAQFIDDLAAAMTQLARSPEQRASMGNAGYRKVCCEYDWERKVDRVLDIFAETLARAAGTPAAQETLPPQPIPATLEKTGAPLRKPALATQEVGVGS